MARLGLKILILGAFFAACAAAVFLLAGMPQLPGFTGRVLASVTGNTLRPGFVGVQKFGNWRLICVPGPGEGNFPSNATTETTPRTANTCRVNQEVAAANDPAQIVIAANLSVVGASRSPALMLRLPATARIGDSILLKLDDSHALSTLVRTCSPRECLAASGITQEDWARLIGARSLQVTFPATGRQMVFVDLAVEGLAEAISGMNLAQTAPR